MCFDLITPLSVVQTTDVRFTICCRTTIGDLEGLFDNYSHKYDRRELVILYARWGPLLCRRGMG